MEKLKKSFYEENTIDVAKGLLGKHLVRFIDGHYKIGKIVEVEAYLGIHDKACHAYKGRTKRTETMFKSGGYAYVYMIYGMYNCFNVVTEKDDVGSAVLIRALEPVKNIALRTQGPGLLTKAMDIDRSLNGYDLNADDIFIIEQNLVLEHEIVARPRIGVDYAQEWSSKPLRYYIKNNQFVSKK